jgi:hypothetical protein
MQWHVVEDAGDAILREALDQPVAIPPRWSQEVVEMPTMHAGRGDNRTSQLASSFELLESLVVAIPDGAALESDLIEALELSPEKCCSDLAQQIRRPQIAPGVPVDLTAEKP